MSIGSMPTANRAPAGLAQHEQPSAGPGAPLGVLFAPSVPLDPRTRTLRFIWLFCAAIGPLLIGIAWPTAYGLYALLALATAFSYGTYPARPQGRLPVLLIAQVALIAVLLIAHGNDRPTLINLMSIAVGSMAIGGLALFLPSDRLGLERTFRGFRIVCSLLIVSGIALGPVLARLFNFSNPIEDLVTGDRLRIFVPDTGHSPLLDSAIIFLMLATSNLLGEKRLTRAIWGGTAVILIRLAGSSIGYIGLLGCIYAFGMEASRISSRIKNGLHIIVCVAALIILPTHADDILLNLRSFQTGGNVSEVYYRGDLTAGRSSLNQQLLYEANEHPIFGSGIDSSVIRYGALAADGTKLALSESGLRLAAKYGWPYFFVVVMICLSPLLTLSTRDRSVRTLGVSMAIYCCTVLAFNSLFEFAHAWSTLAFMPLVLLLAGYGRGKG